MEFLIALRRVAHHRLLCAVGVIVALLVGAVAGGLLLPNPAAGSVVGYGASTKLLIDTPRSQIADATTEAGSSTVVQRSVLLGDSLGDRDSTAHLAEAAGIPVRDVAVAVPPFDPVMVSTYLPDGQLPVRAAQLTRNAVFTPYVVSVVADYSVPILTLSAAGPDSRRTVALLRSAVTQLSVLGRIVRRPTAAPGGTAGLKISQPQSTSSPLGVSVAQLGPIESGAVRSPSAVDRAVTLAAGVLAFSAWCLLILLGDSSAWVRHSRAGRPGR